MGILQKFSLDFAKKFLITRTIFSLSRSKQFSKQNPILSIADNCNVAYCNSNLIMSVKNPQFRSRSFIAQLPLNLLDIGPWCKNNNFAFEFFEVLKFMFSKKATQIDEIFIVDLTLCSECKIDGGNFVNFCGFLRKHKLYKQQNGRGLLMQYLF